MKLHRYIFIGLAVMVTSSFNFPNRSYACWGTSEFNNYECCFVCCSSQTECEEYLHGKSTTCQWNQYCLWNPFYCESSCIREDNPCPISFALNNDEEKIETLRRFRDEVLSKTPIGREYIRLYYEWSPVMVRAMEEDEEFKKEVKELIEHLLPIIETMVQ